MEINRLESETLEECTQRVKANVIAKASEAEEKERKKEKARNDKICCKCNIVPIKGVDCFFGFMSNIHDDNVLRVTLDKFNALTTCTLHLMTSSPLMAYPLEERSTIFIHFVICTLQEYAHRCLHIDSYAVNYLFTKQSP